MLLCDLMKSVEQQEQAAPALAALMSSTSSPPSAGVGVAGCTALVAATVCGGVVAAVAAERAYSGVKVMLHEVKMHDRH